MEKNNMENYFDNYFKEIKEEEEKKEREEAIEKERKLREEYEDSLIGKEFGYLTIKRKVVEDKMFNYKCYECVCRCGKKVLADEKSLLLGDKISCGCISMNEILLLKCKDCGEEIEIPFNKKDLYKRPDTIYTDNEGKEHHKIYLCLDYSCKNCSKLNSSYDMKVNMLERFINQYCETSLEILGDIRRNLEPNMRTLRSEFRKKYKKWLTENDIYDYLLTGKEFNKALGEKYNEYFIKANGNIYLKNIRLAD